MLEKSLNKFDKYFFSIDSFVSHGFACTFHCEFFRQYGSLHFKRKLYMVMVLKLKSRRIRRGKRRKNKSNTVKPSKYTYIGFVCLLRSNTELTPLKSIDDERAPKEEDPQNEIRQWQQKKKHIASLSPSVFIWPWQGKKNCN